MWISKKRWNSIEKRIADLEEQVQSQQRTIIYLSHQDRPLKALSKALDSTLCCPSPTFQVVLDNKTPFLRTSEQSN